MLFKRLLVPIDGSQYANSAIKTAIKIAEKFDSTITLLHISSLATSLPLDMYQRTSSITQEDITKFIASSREAGFAILDRGRQLVEDAGIRVKTLFKEGHIVQEIMTVTKGDRFDLIILGAKGISHIAELSIGSVSEKVVRTVPCAVLVIKEQCG
ncbi:MAG: universal stress protein [Candidatus Bathyarchaeota archaeon]|nr:MAG: universal stress protein [Candidatus Bathyarchaeota archaeon]